MAAQRFIKSAVAKMEHLIKGAVKKLEHAVECAAEQYDRVVESDAKEQDIVTKRANKKPDHAIHGAAKKQDRTKGTVKVHNYAAKDAGKKQVHVIVAAVKEKDLVVQGTVKVQEHVDKSTVKVHDHVKKDAAKEQAHVEGAVIKQDRVVKDAVIKQDNAIKSVDEEPDFYESLEEFRRKYSAEAKASRYYKRPGLLTIVEEDETRDGEPIHNFLEIFQKNKFGKPRTISRLDPPVLLSPISSIASAVPPEPCLLSKCCARIGKNARRNKRKIKRVSKQLVKKSRQHVCDLCTSSVWGCHRKGSHPPRASPYQASRLGHRQSVMNLPIATLSMYQLPPLVF
ncbi:hypothetical protein SEPCBS57363_006640 [Sporothrix epigloea]|uniref:Uncharacterized protein n=1 Tax=Sporothrix epigloea TaxID=1892477 RepID=A0ABP0E8E7_9PEZI